MVWVSHSNLSMSDFYNFFSILFCFRCLRRLRFCAVRWRVWIRPLVLMLYGAAVLALLPFLIVQMIRENINLKTQIWLLGAVFVLLALPITLSEIVQHLIHYTKPKLQKHIVRILWMVPIYALNAVSSPLVEFSTWFGTSIADRFFAVAEFELSRVSDVHGYNSWMLRSLRDLQFYDVSVEFSQYGIQLGDDSQTEAANKAYFSTLLPRTMAHGRVSSGEFFSLVLENLWFLFFLRTLIHRCKHGILQYTIVRPLMTVIALWVE